MSRVQIISLIIIMLLLTSLVYLGFTPIKKTINYCESVNWDGSEYVLKDIYSQDSEILLCDKQKAESDVVVGLVKALWFWEEFASEGGEEK